jgi:hypothetical protein
VALDAVWPVEADTTVVAPAVAIRVDDTLHKPIETIRQVRPRTDSFDYATYLYVFDVPLRGVEEFTLEFEQPWQGCVVSPLTFRAQSHMIYCPLCPVPIP